MNSDGHVILLMLAVIALCYYLAFSYIDATKARYAEFCAKHNLEYVDWNTNAISCFDPKTNAVKAFNYEEVNSR